MKVFNTGVPWLVLVLICGPVLWLTSLLKKLPWQKPEFDTTPVSLPAVTNEKAILIFSKTNGFRHKSIQDGVMAISIAGQSRGWQVVATENATSFNDKYLSHFRVVVFLSTTGDVFTNSQKSAFEAYIKSGGGYAGIHSASDTEHRWEWYDWFIGTHFKSHTLFPRHLPVAEIITETNQHPSTRHLPKNWKRTDEWYNFNSSVAANNDFQILLSLNEASYTSVFPGKMGKDHPISWIHQAGKGRMFYTAMGHTAATFQEPNSLQHILGGIEWAGRL